MKAWDFFICSIRSRALRFYLLPKWWVNESKDRISVHSYVKSDLAGGSNAFDAFGCVLGSRGVGACCMRRRFAVGMRVAHTAWAGAGRHTDSGATVARKCRNFDERDGQH